MPQNQCVFSSAAHQLPCFRAKSLLTSKALSHSAPTQGLGARASPGTRAPPTAGSALRPPVLPASSCSTGRATAACRWARSIGCCSSRYASGTCPYACAWPPTAAGPSSSPNPSTDVCLLIMLGTHSAALQWALVCDSLPGHQALQTRLVHPLSGRADHSRTAFSLPLAYPS